MLLALFDLDAQVWAEKVQLSSCLTSELSGTDKYERAGSVRPFRGRLESRDKGAKHGGLPTSCRCRNSDPVQSVRFKGREARRNAFFLIRSEGEFRRFRRRP